MNNKLGLDPDAFAQQLRRAHCARAENQDPDHVCVGICTITRDGVALDCKRGVVSRARSKQVKGLTELTAENDALVAKAEARAAASLRRLKQRVAACISWDSDLVRRDVREAIDAWDRAERKRGAR